MDPACVGSKLSLLRCAVLSGLSLLGTSPLISVAEASCHTHTSPSCCPKQTYQLREDTSLKALHPPQIHRAGYRGCHRTIYRSQGRHTQTARPGRTVGDFCLLYISTSYLLPCNMTTAICWPLSWEWVRWSSRHFHTMICSNHLFQ